MIFPRDGIVPFFCNIAVGAFRRVAAVPAQSGSFGVLLTCVIAFWWGIAFWSDSSHVAAAKTLAAVQDMVGRQLMATLMALASFGPLVAIVVGSIWLRLLTITIAMTTWLLLAYAVALNSSVISPAVGASVACLIALVNAEYWLAMEWKLTR